RRTAPAFPYTTLFRSPAAHRLGPGAEPHDPAGAPAQALRLRVLHVPDVEPTLLLHGVDRRAAGLPGVLRQGRHPAGSPVPRRDRSEEHTSELQSRENL